MADTTAVKPPEEVTPTPGAESAPAEADGDNGSSIEAPDNGSPEADKSGDGKPGKKGEGVFDTISNLRSDRRRLREENARLLEQIEGFQKTPKQTPRTSAGDDGPSREGPSFFEDPDANLAAREKKFRTQLLNEIVGLSEKQEALKMIHSQTGFSEKDEDAFADLMEEHGLDLLAQAQPVKAARLAMKLWAEEKGIKPVRSEDKARAGSVRGGAPGPGAKKISLSHIRDLQARISKGENVDTELKEAWAAAKEGRIVED